MLDIIKPVSYDTFKEGESGSKSVRVELTFSLPRPGAARDGPAPGHPDSGPKRRPLPVLPVPDLPGAQGATLGRE